MQDQVISGLKWRSPWSKIKTILNFLKMVSGEENNSEGMLSNYESNFLNYIEIGSENWRLTKIVRVSWREFAARSHVVRTRLNTLLMANLHLEYLALY